jgi:lipopolysaccharide transport system permease protein
MTLIVARRRATWVAYVRELARFRDLFGFFVLRDIRVRYSQTVLGLGWSVLQPFLQMVVFSVFFGGLAGIGSGGVPYAVFSIAAVVPWTYFSNAVTNSSSSFVANAQLVGKVYFPRLFIPLSPLGAGLVDLGIGIVLLLGVELVYGYYPSWWALPVVPVLIGLLVLVSAAVSVWLSALGALYRDVRYVAPFFLQILLFVTPIIYVVNRVPASIRPFYALNPLVGIVGGFRGAFLNQPMPVGSIFVSFCSSVVLLVLGLAYFRHVERVFADVA